MTVTGATPDTNIVEEISQKLINNKKDRIKKKISASLKMPAYISKEFNATLTIVLKKKL